MSAPDRAADADEVRVREILTEIERWRAQGRPVALATIVTTWGSAPRPAGSKMAVNDRGEMVGSVSGGCVEAAVVEEALSVLRSGRAKRIHFGVSDDSAWHVGLACGGDIDLFVEPLAPLLRPAAERGPSAFDRIRQAVLDEQSILRAVAIGGDEACFGRSLLLEADGRSWTSMDGPLAEMVLREARGLIAQPVAEVRMCTFKERECTVFLEVLGPAPRLVIVGGVHIAVALTGLARQVGFHVTLVDPRSAFCTRQRFPQADALLALWPDEGLRKAGLTSSTAVAVLSHDPKLDDPALLVALPSPAFYVGALGSAQTQELRRGRLREAGLSEAQIGRLHGPIGLELGGREPAEIALSILAEIIAVRAGRRI